MVRKVILVDDQPTYRYSLQNILKEAGEIEIIGEASDGAQFLELLLHRKPDIVFMDIEMPGLNGIEATKQALKIYPKLIIIGLSLYENQSHINQIINAGAKGYLLKMSNNFSLLQKLLKHPDSEMFFSEGIVYQHLNKATEKKVIAIVDDFETTTFTVEFALKNSGYDVIKSQSPLEMLKEFNGRQIDLLISDYTMPEMPGHEFVKKIKEIPKYRNIPVLMLSSEKDEKKQQLSREAGAFGWIQKPYDLKKFLKIIEQTLKGS